MFGTTIDLKTKLAAVEADLVSAHAISATQLHSEIFQKLAGLIDTNEAEAMLDIEAMLDVVNEEMNPPKVAAGGFGSFGGMAQQKQPGVGMDTGKLLSMGIMLAGPVMAAAKFLTSKSDHDNALTRVIQANPQLFAQNRARAEALFEAVYSSAPNIAKNTVIMGDILKQLMAMPMVDMGTIARLTEMSKNVRPSSSEGNPFEKAVMGRSMEEMKSKFAPSESSGPMAKKSAAVKIAAKFKSAEGLPTIFNWGTPACKAAGLTDAFTGSGTNMEQANQATMMNQQEQGNTLLPLDSVLHELLMKEMELQQREQVMQQQEQQLQQALQAVQQIGSQYQNESGVNPNSGEPAAQEAPPQAAPAAEEAPPASPEEAPPENAAPADEAPPAELGAGEQQSPEANSGGEATPLGDEGVTGEAPVEDPMGLPADVAESQEPTGAEGDPSEIMAGGAEGTGANGDAGVAPVGQDGEGEESAEQNPPGTDEQGDGPESADGTPGAEEQPPAGEESANPNAEDGSTEDQGGNLPGASTDNPAGETGTADETEASDQPPAEESKADPASESSGDGAVVGGEQNDPGQGQESAAPTPPPPAPVDMSPEARAAGEAGLADAAAPMPPADEVQTEGPKDDPLTAQMRALHGAAGGEQGNPTGPGSDAGSEAGATMDPFDSQYSEGSSPMDEPIDNAAPVPPPAMTGEEPAAAPVEGAEAPATEAPPEGSEPAEPPPPIAEGEDTGEEGETPEEGAEGPNTAESVEGSVEDKAKDKALEGAGIEEGTPLEQESDAELAKGLNEAGEVATPVPSQESIAPPAPPQNALPTPATSTPNGSGGHEIVLPLRITVKIGELDPIEARRAEAREAFLAAMNNLPTSSSTK
jgi:hypothetical protein